MAGVARSMEEYRLAVFRALDEAVQKGVMNNHVIDIEIVIGRDWCSVIMIRTYEVAYPIQPEICIAPLCTGVMKLETTEINRFLVPTIVDTSAIVVSDLFQYLRDPDGSFSCDGKFVLLFLDKEKTAAVKNEIGNHLLAVVNASGRYTTAKRFVLTLRALKGAVTAEFEVIPLQPI